MSRKSQREAYTKLLKAVVNDINSQSPEIKHKMMWQWFFVKITLGIFVSIFFFSALFFHFGKLFLQPSALNNSWFETIAFISLCAIAIALYALRQKLLYIYGALEISFSVAVIGQAVNQIKFQGILGWLTAGSAVYVLVRGLDNFVTGYKNPPPYKESNNG